MRRILAVSAGLLCVLIVGCGKEEQQVADVARPNVPPPPPKTKYQPTFNPHDSQVRYTADKPFSGNDATVPQNAPPTKNYVGTVRSVAGNSITLSVNGQDMTFTCAPDVWAGDGSNPRYFQIKDWQTRVRAGSQVRLSTTTTGGAEVVTYVLVTNTNNE
jgi:hypothetical protein